MSDRERSRSRTRNGSREPIPKPPTMSRGHSRSRSRTPPPPKASSRKYRSPRSKNFTEREKILLIEVAKEFVSIIDNKKTDATTVEAKKISWTALTNKYNAVSETGARTEKQLHALYDNLKKKARKNMSGGDKSESNRTGGGTSCPQTTPIDEKVMALFATQNKQPTNDFQSAGPFYNIGVDVEQTNELTEANNFAKSITVKIEADSESEKSTHDGVEDYSSDDSLKLEIDEDSDSEQQSSHSFVLPRTNEDVVVKVEDDWMSEKPSTSKQYEYPKRPLSPQKVDYAGRAPKLQTQPLTETRNNNLNNPTASYIKKNNQREVSENIMAAKRLEILELQRQQEVMKLEKTKLIMDLDIEIKRVLLENAKIDLEMKKFNFKL